MNINAVKCVMFCIFIEVNLAASALHSHRLGLCRQKDRSYRLLGRIGNGFLLVMWLFFGLPPPKKKAEFVVKLQFCIKLVRLIVPIFKLLLVE